MTGVEFSTNSDFWNRLDRFGNAPALVDEASGRVWSYCDLQEAIVAGQDKLRHLGKRLVFLFADNDAGAVICYLSALAAGIPIYLGKGRVAGPETEELLNEYAPDIILWKGEIANFPPQYRWCADLFGYHLAERMSGCDPIGDGIALLLSTSGSLGSPKMVRLSRTGISAAASQVAEALHLAPSHRAITCLPMHFVYGLSVIHGHLAAGASLVMTQRSIQDRAFWRLLDETRATSLAGVPWTFGMLRALSFDPSHHPSLCYLSLSGGAVVPDLLSWLTVLGDDGLRLYSMYGQTEACGRMTVLPPEMLAHKAGSVGLPVKGSRVDCDDAGNIVFHGPNVMLGYARNRGELTDRDDRKGTLATGDTGFLDADGCLYITGRTSRIAKLFGFRIDLGELETFLGGPDGLAVVCTAETLDIYVEKCRTPELERKLAELVQRLRLPGHCMEVHTLASLPRNEYGKIQYSELSAARVGTAG